MILLLLNNERLIKRFTNDYHKNPMSFSTKVTNAYFLLGMTILLTSNR
ncbi:hypothetical protein LDG_7352 [Legionella drancourtii LLAP12]|uniref:Uncharacterized protein n=1 Tax=Legionella drancourtii LLAP12 TaxID=658187 RepID=G9EQ09_9GAMM|nr:hypothetical protein LDG_7352 [Legionella drancourtii LLAP12]